MKKKGQIRTTRSKKKTISSISHEPLRSIEADTASELVEIYESVERSYRASVMAGETFAGVAQSTNY